jgi:hypothetical protein
MTCRHGGRPAVLPTPAWRLGGKCQLLSTTTEQGEHIAVTLSASNYSRWCVLPLLSLPPTRLGHSQSRRPHHSRFYRCRELPFCRYDQEQSQEGAESQAEEGIMNH